MVSRNPLFAVRWSSRLLRATVLDDIWPEILFFTLVATVVCVVSDLTHHDLGISNVLLVVLGNVIILQTVLSLRTSSASERYHEGRALWGSLLASSKNLAQIIWIQIPNHRKTEDGKEDEMSGILEKKSIINLIQALVVSIKHFVRDEKGVDYEDLWPLLRWHPSFSQTISPYSNFNNSSSTLVEDFSQSNSQPLLRRWRSSLSKQDRSSPSGGSTTEVDSDNDIITKASLDRSMTTPVQHTNISPLIPEPGNPVYAWNNILSTSPRSTVYSSASDSEPSMLRISSNKFHGKAHHRYQPLIPSNHHYSSSGAESSSEDDEPTTATQKNPRNRRPRRVRFLSQTLVNPQPQSYIASPENDHLVQKSLLPSSGSTDSLHAQTHLDTVSPTEDGGSVENHRYPQQAASEPTRGYAHILPHVSTQEQLKPAAIPPPERIRDVFPLWRFMTFLGRSIKRIATQDFEKKESSKRRKRNPYIPCESSIPLQIVLTLSNYLAYLHSNDLISSFAVEKSITDALLALQNTTAQLERLTNTPLPFVYQFHLRMCTWFYLLFLPFQILNMFGYLTIPIVAFFTFLLVGFMEIGEEIENPFDYDHNDLDLDGFCLQLQRDLQQISTHMGSEPSTYIFSSTNFPLAPIDWRTAKTLVEGATFTNTGNVQEINNKPLHRTLLHCWRELGVMA